MMVLLSEGEAKMDVITNVNKKPYVLINDETINNKTNQIEPFSNIIGHKVQKREVLKTIEWFKNVKEYTSKGVKIPHGILFFGDPGNGKTLFIKEIISLLNINTYTFNGGKNISKQIYEMFEDIYASKGPALVILDELDLLIDNDNMTIRALQESLDGVENSENILVLGATNDIDDIPPALIRNGRFDKLVYIPYLVNDEALELFNYFVNKYHLSLDPNIDMDDLKKALSNNVSCSTMEAIVNDIALNNGFENITEEIIYASIFNITERIIKPRSIYKEASFNTAIHEAGHAVMAYKYNDVFEICSASVDDDVGYVKTTIKPKYSCLSSTFIKQIEIGLAGYLAEKLICHEISSGSADDLEQVSKLAKNLINLFGYKKVNMIIKKYTNSRDYRLESNSRRYKNEKAIEKVIIKAERKARKYLKKNIDKITSLANLFLSKGRLKAKEIIEAIS